MSIRITDTSIRSQRVLSELEAELVWLRDCSDKFAHPAHYRRETERFRTLMDRIGMPRDSDYARAVSAIRRLISEIQHQFAKDFAWKALDGRFDPTDCDPDSDNSVR